MAGSLLRAIGLPGLVCEDPRAYERQALELARDSSRLRALKQLIHERRATYPLFDTKRFCGHLEAAYIEMHERSRRGQRPASFAVLNPSCAP